MALGIPFLFLTILSQISNFALSANEINGQGCTNLDERPAPLNYRNNVHQLSSLLLSDSSSSDPPTHSYFTTSVGEVSARAYGYYLCRGDLNGKDCQSCVETAHKSITNLDRNIGNDCFVSESNVKCLIPYANRSEFLGFGEEIGFSGGGYGDYLTSSSSQYNTTLSNSMQELLRDARYQNLTKANFATRVVMVEGSREKIYLLVQCRPDMPPINCSNCLSSIHDEMRIGRTTSGKVIGVNCLLKYSNESFFGGANNSFLPNFLSIIVVFVSSVCLVLV
ncbi:putative cysteine-rich repeat secretory protein 7 [Spinacia oleracea]|uniref:Cysteine-rich repeat secretory protein 7 n=1 Tax=Spinacia oleracea TaxID=3562 RepID=A0A9R0JIB5_SPIOL|nr:putative cysteine-rich repeat secretory protein 7 [Spinacia oleracea]